MVLGQSLSLWPGSLSPLSEWLGAEPWGWTPACKGQTVVKPARDKQHPGALLAVLGVRSRSSRYWEKE